MDQAVDEFKIFTEISHDFMMNRASSCMLTRFNNLGIQPDIS